MTQVVSTRRRSGVGLPSGASACPSVVAAARLEQLEPRRLFASVIDVSFGGVTAPAVEDAYIAHVKRGTIGYFTERYGWSDVKSMGGGYYSFTDTQRTPAQIERIAERHGRRLTALSPNWTVGTSAVFATDPFYSTQWGHNNTGQTVPDTTLFPDFSGPSEQTGTEDADIDLPEAWELTTGVPATGQPEVIVAVLDTGYDLTHPDLMDAVFTNPLEIAGNGIDDDANGYIDDVTGFNTLDNNGDITDVDGHGSHTAGIIGARANNSVGIAGVSQGVRILPVKVLGDDGGGTIESVIAGIQYVNDLRAQGFNIVAMNLSLGGFSDFPFTDLESPAIERAGRLDMLVIVSAGNDSVDVDRTLVTPARSSLSRDNVITVAATDNQDDLAGFSNFGFASVQLSAPGVNILSTVPSTAEHETPGSDFFDGTIDGYAYYSGTSEAAPHVAGVAALAKALVPQATAQQIRQAILDGVDSIPSLNGDGFSARQAVSTGGRLNAYNTLRLLTTRLVSRVDNAGGDWKGRYGTQGAVVATDTPALPEVSGVTSLTLSPVSAGAARVTPASLLRDTTGPGDFGTRVDTFNFADESYEIGITLAPGETRRFTLYMADLGTNRRTARTQRVEMVDAETGKVLDSTTVSDFRNGTYLTYTVSGDVIVRVTSVRGPNAILNGFFFDGAPSGAVVEVSRDTTTSGDWSSQYGSQGAVVFGDASVTPQGITIEPVNAATVVARSTTRTIRGPLERLTQPGRGIIAYLSSPVSFDVRITNANTTPQRTTLYFHDDSRRGIGRAVRVEVFGPDGQFAYSRDITNFRSGQYVTLDLPASGTSTIRVTRLAGTSATLSGIFFDSRPTQPASFIGADRTTRGNYLGLYGGEGVFLPGLSTTVPSFINGTIAPDSNGAVSVLRASTSQRSAPIKPNTFRDRISSYIRTPSSTDILLDFNDTAPHRVTLYFADLDNRRRTQRVEIVDSGGNVVTSQTISRFREGVYLTFDVKGDTTIRITRLSGSDAILNGVFFD